MVQDHIWCPPRRYAITVLIHYSVGLCTEEDTVVQCWLVVCKRNGSRHPAIHIGVLAYADDIYLLAKSIDDVECSLHRLETSAAEIGLTINHDKTKVMQIGQASIRHDRFANGEP